MKVRLSESWKPREVGGMVQSRIKGFRAKEMESIILSLNSDLRRKVGNRGRPKSENFGYPKTKRDLRRR